MDHGFGENFNPRCISILNFIFRGELEITWTQMEAFSYASKKMGHQPTKDPSSKQFLLEGW